MNRVAVSSSTKPCTRSSVERSVRDTSDEMTMPRMNSDAILIPSGRSIMLVTVV